MDIIQDGNFPHAAHWYSVTFAEKNVAYVVKGINDECEISEDTSFTVEMEAGDVVIDGEQYGVSSDSVTISEADSDYRRYDLVYLELDNGTPTLEVDEGTPSDEPVHPDIPHPDSNPIVILGVLRIDAGDSSITEIKDARTIKKEPYAEDPHDNDAHSEEFAILELVHDTSFTVDGDSTHTLDVMCDDKIFVGINADEGSSEDGEVSVRIGDADQSGHQTVYFKNHDSSDILLEVEVFKLVTPSGMS